MALIPSQTSQFRRDIKLVMRRRKKITLLEEIIRKLAAEKILPPKNKDHGLTGNCKSYRECHIEPDWLLIYKVDDDDLVLVRTGSHSDIFG